ncbi:MAG: carbohydrate kinase [Deltaproteobacteria bacterium]|nr:MAG: carbohydrate kinase [Deltaproteobacteria bacterium]
MGLDLSTQGLTAVVIDLRGSGILRFAINFDDCFPVYKTKDGVLQNDDPTVVHSVPKMWADAVDSMLLILKKKKLSPKIESISVSAQQHGTVYLNDTAATCLRQLDPSRPLASQTSNIFSRSTAPVWMDLSTAKECQEITELLGDREHAAHLTGSIVTARFMGPQIRKFWKESPDKYHQTAHIALVSSYITSLLTGKLSPVDTGDGFGTNLANVKTGKWSREALRATAPKLYAKLPRIVRRDKVVGKVSPYLVQRYRFKPDTIINIGSGDNPNSLVGLGMIGDSSKKAISLGTSDTYFGYLSRLPTAERSEGHIFGTANGKYMALNCHKNGSLAREHIKNRFGLSWDEFSDVLSRTRPGNGGKIMLPFFAPEITPPVAKSQVWRFGGLREDDMAANVRGVAEGQIISMYVHSEWIGKRPQIILVTAGGSQNRELLRLIAQIFNAGVQTFELEDSAALGAAIRSARLLQQCRGFTPSWGELYEKFIKYQKAEALSPEKEHQPIYHGPNGLIDAYKSCERYALEGGVKPDAIIAQFKEVYGR